MTIRDKTKNWVDSQLDPMDTEQAWPDPIVSQIRRMSELKELREFPCNAGYGYVRGRFEPDGVAFCRQSYKRRVISAMSLGFPISKEIWKNQVMKGP